MGDEAVNIMDRKVLESSLQELSETTSRKDTFKLETRCSAPRSGEKQIRTYVANVVRAFNAL